MIIFLSIFIWGMYFYIGVIVLDACKISLGYVEVGVLTVISSFIIGIPSLPGAAGTLHSWGKICFRRRFSNICTQSIKLCYYFTCDIIFSTISNWFYILPN